MSTDKLALALINVGLSLTTFGIVWHLAGLEWAVAVLCGMIYVRDAHER
jgi:hypothetical protein